VTVIARRARCPASSANLGPGFDTLGIALGLHVEVEVRPAGRLAVRTVGEGSELPADHTHLAARVAIGVAGTDALEVRVRSDIPVARGLGSSAALAAAAAAAAGSPDPLSVAARVDGHAENAAASVLGGLVTATMLGGQPVASGLPLDEALCFVAVVPDHALHTRDARTALPDAVPFADAVFNLGRMGLLLSGLADRRRLVREATEDRLHQPYRGPLFPAAPVVIAGLVDAGAAAACWSGAGPTLLAICDEEVAEQVRKAGEALLEQTGVPGRALRLAPDRAGLVVERV
jgi:homoserine kinase